MTKLILCSYHSRIHDLMRVKVTRVELPITLIVSGLGPGLAVVPDLTPGVLVEGQTWASPIVQQLLGGWLVVGTSLDYGN